MSKQKLDRTNEQTNKWTNGQMDKWTIKMVARNRTNQLDKFKNSIVHLRLTNEWIIIGKIIIFLKKITTKKRQANDKQTKKQTNKLSNNVDIFICTKLRCICGRSKQVSLYGSVAFLTRAANHVFSNTTSQVQRIIAHVLFMVGVRSK